MRTTLALTFLAFACLGQTYCAPLADTETPVNYRLPTTIVPLHYNISLRPYLLETEANRFTFDGEAFITVNVTVKTKEIVMHSKNLKFKLRQYWNENLTKNTPMEDVKSNNLSNIDTYTLGNELPTGIYVLHFQYTGLMEDDMHGFYKSSYTDPKNETKWLGSTQFQTNHARRAFPCFDEPNFKATFNISLIHHRSMKTFSNTRIIRSFTEGEYVTDIYAITPRMSTYIVAFLVAEFNERSDGEFGVIARPEYYPQTEYSYYVGKKILEQLDNYFSIKYYDMGNDKMHMAAIPDFSAGAMENWGLLTYRERSLLFDEISSSLSAKQSIAAVVAHEQAHMWFGDLVTCDWWSYAWLNEGFARYFQYFATAEVEKDFQLEQQFAVDQVQSVMSLDSINSTNPMSDNNTNTPSDLSRMFNSITYNKGASFIRMVKYVLGEEKFQKSLQEYLNANQYKNTKPSDLFNVWKNHMDNDFKSFSDSFFSSFTEQVGYPLVTFTMVSENSVEISQKRFLLKENDGSDSSLRYTVPITYTTSADKNFNETKPKIFIEASNKDSVKRNLEKNAKWVIGNIQQTGYYRVNYDNKTWHAIHSALLEKDWSGIHEQNRAQLVDDLFNLARASVVDYQLALDIFEYLATETHYQPWTSAFNGYSYLHIRLGTDVKNFEKYIRDLTSKAYNSLGFDERASDTTLDIYNRAKILAWNCKFGKESCINKAKSYFRDLDNKRVPVNVRSVVYCTAMRQGTESDFNKLFSKYKNETVATEVSLIVNSLGCVKDTKLVEKYFDIIISDEIRRQDKSSAMTSLYSENNENVEVVFDLIDKNFDKMEKAFGSPSDVANIVASLAARFTTKEQETKLKTFNDKHKGKEYYNTLSSAQKTVEDNLAWSEKKLGAFKSYLEKRGKNSSATLSAFTALTLVMFAVISMMFQ